MLVKSFNFMPLSAGERLGPYEILTPIGAGVRRRFWTVHWRHADCHRHNEIEYENGGGAVARRMDRSWKRALARKSAIQLAREPP
jgi:hypothetical protein